MSISQSIAIIDQNITTNGNGEITGQILNQTLKTMLSSSINIIDTTYSELYSKINTSELEEGIWYRINDYRSVNFLNGWEIADNKPTPVDTNFNPQEIYEGDVEVLLVQAISPNQTAEIGYSETFTDDILQYQPYTNKIGVDIGGIYNGRNLPPSNTLFILDPLTVSGFDLEWDGTNVYFNMPTGYPALFGHYFYVYCEFQGETTYYQDGCFEPLTPGVVTCQYPFTSDDPDFTYPKAMSRIQVVNNGMKVILLDLTETDYDNYVNDTLYVETVHAIGDAYGWITKRIDTQRNITAPFDFRARKYRRFEVDLTPVNSSLGVGYYGQGDNFLGQGTTGNYIDVRSFGQDGYDTHNIEWNDMGGPDMNWYAGYNDNNVFLGNFYRNKLDSFSRNNTQTNNSVQNIIGHSFYNNVISDGFNFNTIGNDYNNNKIGNNFSYNKIDNDFSNNTIDEYFYWNIINTTFQSNTIGNYFYNNSTVHSFFSNVIGNGFRTNNITYPVTNTNFTSSSHVYNDYNCNIGKASNGSLYLSYFNGTSLIFTSSIA